MQHLKPSDLFNMLLTGSSRVIEEKEKMNAINVFPVPDCDTGTNLANTLQAVRDVLQKEKMISSEEVIDTVLDACLSSSQGNSGIMMVSFLHGLLSELKGKKEILLTDFVEALQNGTIHARGSVQDPKQGTMLDVMDAFSWGMQKALEEKNVSFDEAYISALEKTKLALVETEMRMNVLKTNHVVDAGALGFTVFVYGCYEAINKKKLTFSYNVQKPIAKQDITFGKFPFEVVFLIEKPLLSPEQLRVMFDPLGDSLDIVAIHDKIKLHIHTDTPEVVKETALLTGEVDKLEVVDMRLSGIHE